MPYTPGTNMSEAQVDDVIHFFFLLDNSGSMYGKAIQTLNEAMSNVLTEIHIAARKLEVTAIIHVASFSDDIHWLLGTQPANGVECDGTLTWTDLSADAGTNTAGAIRALVQSDALSRRHLGHRAYPPIIILITDGASNNPDDTKKAILELISRQKSMRIAIGVEGYKPDELEAFASEAVVSYEDNLGNVTGEQKQKLIFTVDKDIDFGTLLRQLAVSSLISSKLQGQGDMAGDTGSAGQTGTPADNDVPKISMVDPNAPPVNEDDVWD